jgi:hypothetical protein
MHRIVILFSLIFCLFHNVNGQDFQRRIDSLNIELKKASEESKPEIYMRLGYYHSKFDSVELGIELLFKAINAAYLFQQMPIIIDSRCFLGDIYLQMDDISNA